MQSGNPADPTEGAGMSRLLIGRSDGEGALEEPPADFTLWQNEPNPFQEKTEISFHLGEAGRVRLRVYDLLGRHVQTLVDATLQANHYTVLLNGRTFVSGVYLYRLETPFGTKTLKMTLLK